MAHDAGPASDARDEPESDDVDALDASEAARIRRRDRDADAAARDLMRPGMGKVFKQIQDAQAKAARDEAPVRRSTARRRSSR